MFEVLAAASYRQEMFCSSEVLSSRLIEARANAGPRRLRVSANSLSSTVLPERRKQQSGGALQAAVPS